MLGGYSEGALMVRGEEAGRIRRGRECGNAMRMLGECLKVREGSEDAGEWREVQCGDTVWECGVGRCSVAEGTARMEVVEG